MSALSAIFSVRKATPSCISWCFITSRWSDATQPTPLYALLDDGDLYKDFEVDNQRIFIDLLFLIFDYIFEYILK